MSDHLCTPKGVWVRHADHGLGRDHFIILDEILASQKPGFFIGVFPLPEGVASLPSAIYGPSVGDDPVGEDEVEYVVRGDRPGPSRLVDRPHREGRGMVVCGIAGVDPIIFTAYGTQADDPAPREWWDASMKPLEALEAAKFWSEHALAR